MRPGRWLLTSVMLTILLTPLSAQGAINCSITTVGVAFGLYNVFATAPLSSAGSLTVRCRGIGVGVDPISISLNPGTSGSFQPRKMSRSGETLNYNLYLDPNGSQIWGDGTSGTQRFASVSNNQALTLTIFGRIFPGQDVSVGTYTDTIIATVDF